MEAYTQEQMTLYNALANCTVRMQGGDETAYNDIYNMMFSHVNALIKSRGISEDDCVDIAQETMISVYKYINTINDPQSTYKWIMSLASNKIADYFRKNSKRIENETYIAAEDEDDMGEAERLYNMSHDTQSGQISLKVPEDIFVNREKQQMLIGVVNSLKDEQKQIVMMHCFSDMTFKDIASALGVSENTVKTKFYRSLNKLESSIYEVEKREGVRLHTVGFVPFMLFLFMLYSQNTPICTQTIETVTNRIGKQITDMHNMAAQNAGQGGNDPNDTNHNGNTANNNYNANAKMKADAAQARSAMNANAVKGLQTGTKVGIKAFVSTHKIASIVVGTIIAGSAVGGGIYAATAADSQDVDIVYDNVVKDTSADTEVIETSETQKLTDEEVFNDFLSTMTFVSGDVGTIDCTSGGPMGEQYITDVSINDPIGSCIADFDGDGEKELLVVNYSGDSGITLNIYENINGECVRSDEATFSDDGLIWNEKNVDVMLYEQNNNVYILLQYCSVYEYLGDGTYCGFALCHYDGGSLISDYNNYFYGSDVEDDRYISDAEQLCAFLGIVNYDEEEILYTACFSKYLATEQMVVSLRTTPAFSDSNGNEFRAYEEQLKNGSLSRFTVGNVSIKSYTN